MGEDENLKIDKRFLKMEEKSFDPSKLAKFLIQAGEAIKNLQESAKKDEPCQNCRKSDNLLDEKIRELAAEKAKTKRLTEEIQKIEKRQARIEASHKKKVELLRKKLDKKGKSGEHTIRWLRDQSQARDLGDQLQTSQIAPPSGLPNPFNSSATRNSRNSLP